MRQAVLLLAAVLLGGCTAMNKVFYDDDFVDGNNAYQRGDYITAAAYYKTACDERSDKGSCYNLGHIYYDDKDFANAIVYFRKACDVRNPKGCHAIGYMYEMGEGLTQSYSEAVPYYDKACGWGMYEACKDLSKLYANGLGVAKDTVKAQNLLEGSCTNSDDGASECYKFGKSYLDSQDTANAERIFKIGCDKVSGGGDSCKELAKLYLQGSKKDYFKASSYLEKACKPVYYSGSKDVESCYELGVLYTDRKSPIASVSEAKNYFNQACETRADVDMCYKIALLCTDKKSGIYDMQEAKNYFHKACTFGSKDGCNAEKKIQ
jgi:TPR repeat protein